MPFIERQVLKPSADTDSGPNKTKPAVQNTTGSIYQL